MRWPRALLPALLLGRRLRGRCYICGDPIRADLLVCHAHSWAYAYLENELRGGGER